MAVFWNGVVFGIDTRVGPDFELPGICFFSDSALGIINNYTFVTCVNLLIQLTTFCTKPFA